MHINIDSVSEEDWQAIDAYAQKAEALIGRHYEPGFGVSPSGSERENFFGQVWARDFAQSAVNHFAHAEPRAAIDSLETLLRHQREDGMLPYRVEREYSAVRIALPFPGSWRIAKPLFQFFEKGVRGRKERAGYEGEFNGAEDTTPALILAASAVFARSEVGKKFVAAHLPQLRKALGAFRRKTDPRDGLAVVTLHNPDWTETIQRTGKLGFVNVLYAESLRRLSDMERASGETADADAHQEAYERTRASVLHELYDADGAYFRAKAGEDRLDAAASVFGAKYLLSPEDAANVVRTLASRVGRASGLANFDPKYPLSEILWIPALFGNSGYHNEFVWPWLTGEYVKLVALTAEKLPEGDMKEIMQADAVLALARMARMFESAGGAYEIFLPDRPLPARSFFYHPPKNLLGSLAGYLGAYSLFKQLGWRS